MGNNAAYTVFEFVVIDAYNHNKLDKALLTILMEPHRHTDIDAGGAQDLETKDGKTLEEVVIEAWGLPLPPKPDNNADDETWGHYSKMICALMRRVTDHFEWR